MTVSFPAKLRPFVRQELASGRYRSEDELVLDAVKLLREMRKRHRQLGADIQHAIKQLERGEGEPLDMQAIKTKARARFATGKKR